MMVSDLVRALKIVQIRVSNPEDALRAANDLLLLHIDDERVTQVYRVIQGEPVYLTPVVIEPKEQEQQ